MILAISSGHNKGTGARAYNGDDEWEHNEYLRKLIVQECRRHGVEVHSFERDRSLRYTAAMRKLAGQIKSVGADVCLELHFNSGPKAAHGFEFIHYKGSKGGARLARVLAKSFGMFGLRFAPRRGTGTLARGRWSRGSGYLRLTPCPAIIVETHFGSNKADHEAAIKTRGAQAQAIVCALRNF